MVVTVSMYLMIPLARCMHARESNANLSDFFVMSAVLGTCVQPVDSTQHLLSIRPGVDTVSCVFPRCQLGANAGEM